MHDRARNLVASNVRMHIAEQSLSMQEALMTVKEYVNSRGCATLSDLPVNEVWDGATEICRLMAVKARDKKARSF